jgi:hypothetical protein
MESQPNGWSVFKAYHVPAGTANHVRLVSVTNPLLQPTTLASATAYANNLADQDQFTLTSPTAPQVTYHVKPHDTAIAKPYQA